MTEDMPPPPPVPPFVHDVERPVANRKASVALGLGVAALLCVPLLTIVLAPAALLVGMMARREIDARPGSYTNRGMATAGMVCAAVAVAIAVVYLVYRAGR